MLSLTLSIAALFFCTEPAAAQQQPPPQSGQVEQSLQKKKDPKEDPTKPKPKVELQPREEMKSEDDTKVRIKVEKLKVTGAKSFPESDLLDVARAPGGVVGREMTLAELKQAANHITQHYRTEGFGLAWAYIPVQDVKDGVVEIAVIEGRIDKILVSGNSYYSADFIIDHVDRLQKQRTLSVAELERELLVLNTYPGLSTRAVLRQGDSPGTTDLYLEAEDKFPVLFSIDFDNFGPKSTGQDRLGATLQVVDLFDAGHWVTLRGVSSVDTGHGDTTNGRLDYNIPFKDGSKIDVYGSLYDYKAKGKISILGASGSGEVFGVDVSRPFILSQSTTLTGDIGFDYKNLKQELLSIQNADDKLRVIYAGGNFEYTDELEGRWVLGANIRQGLGHFLGGLQKDDLNSSRFHADDSFTKLDFTFFRLQKINSWFSLILKAQAQAAWHELVVSEQFALGGQDTVRGYAPFEFMGDYGYAATLEGRFNIPWFQDVQDPLREGRSIFDMVQICGFYDTGEGVRISPLQGERRRLILGGAGGGLRLAYPDRLSIRFDVGLPVTGYKSASGQDIFYYISLILTLN